MRTSSKTSRKLFTVCLLLVSLLFGIHVWISNDATQAVKTQEPYQFLAKDLKYSNSTLTLHGAFKNLKGSDIILEIDNISSVIKEIIRDYEDRKASQKALLMTQRERFGVSAPKNATLVSYSPLYKSSERTVTLPQQISFLGKHRHNRENVNCGLLFEGDTNEVEKAKRLSKSFPTSNPSKTYASRTRNCSAFVHSRGYIMDPLTEEERNFPLAYGIMVYKSPEQFEILLRAIYRPQNSYCVHVDKKTTSIVFKEFESIAHCFPNVFLASTRIDVQWGYMSVLTQDLVCMKDLLKHKKWKYFINLTGQEFPLRTNYELVKILTIYNGANDLEGTVQRANKVRWLAAGPPPHQIHPVKGSVHITVNRGFVDYVINNPVAKDFLNWSRKVAVPDETFFASLNHNPHLRIPGTYKGEPETDREEKPFLTRFKNWGTGVFNWPCYGRRVRQICIFGIGDLPLLARRPEFFANKFYLYYQTYALQCMEELHFNRTRDEYLQRLHFQTDYYENLEFIKHVV